MTTFSAIRAYIAIGSNVTSERGDPRSHVEAAFDELGRLDGTRLFARSSILRTSPVGPQDQDDYLNAVAGVDTVLSPRELLDGLLAIERMHGRDRDQERRWGPRTLDLDLILYGSERIEEQGLSVPHPRMHERLFVLEPLEEVAPDLLVPGIGKTVGELVRQLRGG
jgi:2-amino-4-hydroxy-6-hydroxymethyldihydropteridine diphosphokinase